MKTELLAQAVLADERRLELRLAIAGDAADMADIVHDAFSHRQPCGNPPAALGETATSLAAQLDNGYGVLATVDCVPAGLVLVNTSTQAQDFAVNALAGCGDTAAVPDADAVRGAANLANTQVVEITRVAQISRVSVKPEFQRVGIATAMVAMAIELLAQQGFYNVWLEARAEFPQVVSLWKSNGFVAVSQVDNSIFLCRRVPINITVPTATDMQELGRKLASLVRWGDMIVLNGELGAGKTTLTQGLGAGMNVAGAVISPTFVLSRIHPALETGPALIHVDAYRLDSAAELADLDLGSDGVVVVEWGQGLVEELTSERLEITIARMADGDARIVLIDGVGARWNGLREEWDAISD